VSTRVPESALRSSVLFNMARSQNQVIKLGEQISSGKRLNSAGDNPADFARAKNLRGVLTTTHQYQTNVGRADDQLSVTESTLASIQQVVDRSGELALAMANGTVDASQRATMTVEVQHLSDELVTLGNTQLNGRYLFGGTQTGRPPFTAQGIYQGNSDLRSVEVGEGVTVDVNIPGNTVLSGAGGGVDAFTVLSQLKTALNANNGPAISATLDSFQKLGDQVTQSRMVAGLQLTKLENRRVNLDEVAFQTERLLSGREDVDMAAAVSELVVQQNTLEVTRNVLGKILNQRSLFDFIG